MLQHPRNEYMAAALTSARQSAAEHQYAIGSVVVAPDGRILSVAHTSVHEDRDPTCHSELNAIRAACRKLGTRHLEKCWLYSTLEPCPMCASAAVWAKMEGVVYGAGQEDAAWEARNLKDGRFTWRRIGIPARHVLDNGQPRVSCVPDFMRQECAEVLKLNARQD